MSYIDPTGLKVKIKIKRVGTTADGIKGTIGVTSDQMLVGSFNGFTVENKNPPNASLPVPPGTYSGFVRTDYTPNRVQLNSVPNASGVQIHNGNNPNQAVGCFLAGKNETPTGVSSSVDAMNSINSIINADGSNDIEIIVEGL